jgi:hypothetical protein
VAADCWVCTGKDCSRSKGHDALVSAASEAGSVELVRCQKICSGPVFGTVVQGRIEWFEKVRGRKSRAAAILLALDDGPVPDRLAARRVKKRSGRLRT